MIAQISEANLRSKQNPLCLLNNRVPVLWCIERVNWMNLTLNCINSYCVLLFALYFSVAKLWTGWHNNKKIHLLLDVNLAGVFVQRGLISLDFHKHNEQPPANRNRFQTEVNTSILITPTANMKHTRQMLCD